MDCPLCHCPWSSPETVPRILHCGHTLCEACAGKKFISCKILCEECSFFHVFEVDRDFNETDEEYSRKCVGSLSKNFSLLSIINNQKVSTDVEFEFEYCDEHNLPLHSYSVKPESYLCDQCIEEVREMGLDIKPLPYVEEYFNGLTEKLLKRISDSSAKTSEQLEKFKENEDNERLKAEVLVSGFFNRFIDCVEIVERGREQELSSMIDSLRLSNEENKLLIIHKKERLDDIAEQVRNLLKLPDQELAQRSELCDILENDIKPLQEIAALKSIIFSSNKAKIFKIKNILENSFKIQAKKNTNQWTCTKCSGFNLDGLIICQNCKIFRPIETYPNLSRHPSQASQQELHELNLRRQLEIQRISQLDKIDPQGKFYLIHAGWVNKWKEFVLLKNQDKSSVGVLPPGPICNNLLFENEQCSSVKKKLKAAVDYRGLNEQVWKAYLEIYGGGPEIVRKKVNIYESKQV